MKVRDGDEDEEERRFQCAGDMLWVGITIL